MKKKYPWPYSPLGIGLYELKSLKVNKDEINELKCLHFGVMIFHIYDPRNVYRQNCTKRHYTSLYVPMIVPEHGKTKNLYNALRKDQPGDEVGPSHDR